MAGPVKLCDACRRREAVYIRTYSGQKLCIICLRRTLERAVRRAVSEAGGLPPRSSIVVPITFTAPHLSMALVDVASRVERRFGSKIIALLPSEVEVHKIDVLEGSGVEVIHLDVKPPGEATLNECLRFDAAWSAHIAAAIGADAVFLPVTLTDRILAVLDSLILGETWMMSDSLISRRVGSVRVIHAFGIIEGETVAAYAARIGAVAWSPCRVRSPSKKVFYSIAYRRPELEYSAFKTISKLSEAARRGGDCSVCGGLASGEETTVCPICEKLRPLDRIRFKVSR